MTLATGSRLGPYEILSPLGAGGMGEVYRAKDTRLERSVAIKVLPELLAQNSDLRARFEREAKAVSSLNHPHICVLHDVGHQDGTDYLVMELVEGETLLDRLKKGPLPLDQTLRYGIQIADALDRAHRQGVIHRDLKPGNVMLTKAGSKLMDFGLAKRALAGDGGGGGVSALPTQEKPLTEAGSVLGTYQYMSPEQLEGKDADARADIWALGCVLYEMATGKRAFEGKSQASLISAILKDEPVPIAKLQPMTPPALDRLVKVCLAKDPDDRLQTAHDVMQELKWIAEGGPAASGTAALRHTREWWLVAALGVALIGIAALLLRTTQPMQVVRFDVPAPEGSELQLYLAVSPDGTRLAFTARGEDGLDRLYLRSLESGKSEPIGGTEDALQPFWSPDGRSVGFFAQGKLKRVEIGAGGPQVICSVTELRGATWSRDGTILFGITAASGLWRVPATGGVPEPVSSPDAAQGEMSHRWPSFLSDGQRFLYVVLKAGGTSIRVGSLDGEKPRRLIDGVSAPSYASSGHLLFVRDGALRAQAFDASRNRLTGEEVTVAEPVQLDPNMWGGAAVSAGGAVLAYRSGAIGMTQLTWLDREGREQGSVGSPVDYSAPVLSPDGRTVVSPVRGAKQLALLDVATGAFVPFTFKTESVAAPRWSPDGRSIAYSSNRNGAFDIFLAPASGGSAEERLVVGGSIYANDFSPDGRLLIYESMDPKTQSDLSVIPLEGERKPKAFLRTEAMEFHASFSPNGRWVAYTSNATGRAEVYVRAFPSGEGPWQVSSEGGDQARWRRNGSELFYMSLDRRMMGVAVNGEGAAFKASPPRALFRARTRAPGNQAFRGAYSVSADGQRFLITKLVEDPAKATITVVVNWASKLQQ
jgi:eukaryotic-like serine/threonine-protein kinase